MVDTVIDKRPAEADATARLRDVIKRIHDAADPMSEMVALESALRHSRDGWRDARRLLVAPFVKEGKLAPAIAAAGNTGHRLPGTRRRTPPARQPLRSHRAMGPRHRAG